MASIKRRCQRLHRPTREEFWGHFYKNQIPCVISGLDFGPCVDTWTPSNIRSLIGDRKVSVHVSSQPRLDFVNKNFSYELMSIEDMLNHLRAAGSESSPCRQWLYYRALGLKPYKDVANLEQTFGESFASGFKMPPSLDPSGEGCTLFSSVFRMAAPGLQLWTHYDVPDNFLFQVHGYKRLLLMPPDQVMNMYITDSSSPVLDIWDEHPDFEKHPLARLALEHPHTCIAELGPGDVLFIPAFWLHASNALEVPPPSAAGRVGSLGGLEGGEKSFEYPWVNLSINSFFKRGDLLPTEYYDTKDIYGNKDPPVVQRSARALLSNVIKPIEDASFLSPSSRRFFLLKMAAQLAQLAQKQVTDEEGEGAGGAVDTSSAA